MFRSFSTFRTLQRKITSNTLKTKQKNSNSNEWLSRQLSDPYVEKAKQMNYRCRSAFKLVEINNKYQFLKPGQVVIDVGAAPGSWSQVIANKINSNGQDQNAPKGIAIAMDKQQIYPIDGVTIFGNMDFTKAENQQKIIHFLEGKRANALVSDMAPSATGIRQLDNEIIIDLCYNVLRFAVKVSEPNATLLVKLWQCGETKKLECDIARFYKNVKLVKPDSSRSDSAEIFLIGMDFKGLKEN